MQDESLMAIYAKGNHQAFTCLYQRHKTKLYRFLARQCSDKTVCEELTHDTWLAVINRASSYQASANFTTWLYRIAHNRLVDHWRKAKHAKQFLFEEISEQIELSNDTQNTNSGIANLEIADLLKSVESLPREQTETLLLKIEGFSRAEIADITQTKQETVKSRLRYANQHLRLALEPNS